MTIYPNPPESQVRQLLAESGLPASDLSPKHLETFFACGPIESPSGVIGLEIYGNAALLRSLAVSQESRGSGYGKALLRHAEEYAQSRGVTDLYLLTTTAAGFFERLGYTRTDRERAPGTIRQTQEFSVLCPSDSAFMVKMLQAEPAKPDTIWREAPAGWKPK